MTDTQKIQLINSVICNAYEHMINEERIDRGAFFEGVLQAVWTIVCKEFKENA